MAVGFQTRIVAQISIQNVNNQGNPLSQVLTLGGPGNPATIFAPCIGVAGGEAAAVTAALAVLNTAITTVCATAFANELTAMETAGG